MICQSCKLKLINWKHIKCLSAVRMERGSLLCKGQHRQIVQQFKNNAPQHKTAKNLGISSFMVQYINIKISKKGLWESGEISVSKDQGPKPILYIHNPLRWHHIKNRYDSVVKITAWAQEHLWKPLSLNTVCHCIHKCRLKLYNSKKRPYINQITDASSAPKLI